MNDRADRQSASPVEETVQWSPRRPSFAEGSAHCAEAVAWVAGILHNGLTQVYAVQLAECFEAKHRARVVECLRTQFSDSDLARLEAALHAWADAEPSERVSIVEQVGSMILAGVDRVLEQAQAAGRDRTGIHLAAARFGLEVVILADPDPHLAWLLPTTQTRLREALAELGFYPTAAETQEVDLEQGDVLQFLGVEFRGARDRHGAWHVHYQRMSNATASDPAAEAADHAAATEPAPTPTPQARERPTPANRKPPTPANEPEEPTDDAGTNAERARRLQWLLGLWPIGAAPRHHDVRGLTDPNELVPAPLRRVAGLQVSWRHLPITLYPVLGFTIGWTSLLTWLCLALLTLCNLHSLPAVLGFAWRRPLELLLAICGIGAAGSAYSLFADLSAQMSWEVSAPKMPRGFYHGQYNVSWDADPVQYGLYLPPHFQQEQGPFPLIVVLHHGGVQSKKEGMFSQGVPYAIVHHFGENTKNGRFDFAVFLPLNPGHGWEPRSDRVGEIMKALSYIIRRHRIDPARVYLTGVCFGADAVWRWAEAYPDQWAAVVPIADNTSPDVQKVRHIPAWMFRGARDNENLVQQDRALAQRLKEAGADVRYTEFPDYAHNVWHVYDRKELYDWLKEKVRR